TAEPLASMMPADVQDAVLRATLWQYVLWRGGDFFCTAPFRPDILLSLSDRAVGDAYATWYNYGNPDSPQTKYGKTGTVTIDQDSADFLSSDPSVYQVNFWRTAIVPGQPVSRSHWTAFVHFKLVQAISLKDRTSFN